jgi:hypothetical protein
VTTHPDTGPPGRKSPAPPQRRAPRNTTNAADATAYRAEDGYSAPTAEDRAVARAIEVLTAHGYGIAARCLDCRHPIFSDASLRRMRGPRCHARAVQDDA